MTRVVVIGGANLDIKAKTAAAHIDATSNPAHIVTKAGGVGRNIAHNLARLGVEVQLVTALGHGPDADMILGETTRAGVDTRNIVRSTKSTGTYIAILDHSGELVTAVNDMEILETLTPELMRGLESAIVASRYVVADCNLSVKTLLVLAELCGDRLVIEPVSVPKSKKLLTLLHQHKIFLATPNLDQLESLTGTRDVEIGARKLNAFGLRHVVIHAGERGAYSFDGQIMVHSSSQAQSIVDVTGAGDAATAGLIAGVAQNLPLAKAAELGQRAAATVIASESSTLP